MNNRTRYQKKSGLSRSQRMTVLVAILLFVLCCYASDVHGQDRSDDLVYSMNPVAPSLVVHMMDTTSTIKLVDFDWVNIVGRTINRGEFTVRVLNPANSLLTVCIAVTDKTGVQEQRICSNDPGLFTQVGDTTIFHCQEPLTIEAGLATVSVSTR